MRVKQSGGRVFGAELTAKERKAMEIEINRQIAESDRKYRNDVDAMILYTLRAHLGFGKKRLRRFYEAFSIEHQKLLDHYELPDGDNVWIADRELKKIGVDVAAWNAEKDEGAK